MKTKLGISVGLVGAAMFLAALFGGYMIALLFAGYILLFEENAWLRRSAVKAIALMLMISFLLTVIGLIPDLLSWIHSIVAIFKGSFSYDIVSSVLSVFTRAIDIIRTVLFLLLGVKALNQGTITIPVVDNFINKYM